MVLVLRLDSCRTRTSSSCSLAGLATSGDLHGLISPCRGARILRKTHDSLTDWVQQRSLLRQFAAHIRRRRAEAGVVEEQGGEEEQQEEEERVTLSDDCVVQ